MKLDFVGARTLAIPFNVAFRHASAERNATQTLWVETHAQGAAAGFGEGCPREYVTSESLDSARAFVRAHAGEWIDRVGDVASMVEWAERHRADIDANPAAWTAVEIALLDLVGRLEGRSVESLLGLPELAGRFRYTAVLGDAGAAKFEGQLAHYLKAGFRDFKIKLSGEAARDLAKVRALAAAGISPRQVRADANNLWVDAATAVRALGDLDFPFMALEEPLRAGDYDGMASIAKALKTRIILDESLSRAAQLARFSDTADRWIVNLRVSKMGGLVRSLEVAREARRRGLGLIVGAHVGETSVLTRAGLAIAASIGDGLLAQEGAFGTHLLARDVTQRPIMFGAGGVLDIAALELEPAGLGFAIAVPEADLDAAIER